MDKKIILSPENIKSSLAIFHLKDHPPLINYPNGDLVETLRLLSSGLDIVADLIEKLLQEKEILIKEESRIIQGIAICQKCRRPVQHCFCGNPFERR